MHPSGRKIIASLAGLLLVAVAAPAGAATPGDPRSEHERVVAFWTHERVARAQPRDFVLDPSGRLVPAERGKPGTGGGGGTTTAGSSWPGLDTLVDATTGKVLFAMGSSYYVCSASIATNPAGAAPTSVILTAAHCVYDETADQFATNWVFIPDYDHAPAPLSTSQAAYCPDTRYGCWSAERLGVHNGYASESGFPKAALPFDFGFAVVGSGGNDSTSPDLDAKLGAQAIDFVARPASAYAFGYPASGKYRGNDLVYCNGLLGDDLANGNDTYAMTCGMTGGSSGGPWLQNFVTGSGVGTLVSVNSYGYSGVKKMFGPKFGPNTEAVHAATASGTGNVIVG